MDWEGLSRLVPEVGILVVVGYFSLKALGIFRDIVKEMEERNAKNTTKLVKSIDRNTKVTELADKYLRERNGRDAEVHKENIKAIKAIVPEMKKVADTSVKLGVDGVAKMLRHIPEQRIDHQEVHQQKVDK